MQFMEYRHPGSQSDKKFKTLMTETKVMLTIFWGASGVLYTEFLTKGLTVNSNRGPHIHSGSTTFLQPRFGTVGHLTVPKIERDVERSPFFNGCRSSGSHAQMDTQPMRMFLHGWNEEIYRTIEHIFIG
ncbi:hypothetical protein TNCV_2541101 [Trichonephila clavipes]|nr:hypothetical protein TNCV_2541101 [Trichonephila clavipes]